MMADYTSPEHKPTPLEAAVRNNDPTSIQKLIANGADVNERNLFGEGLVHVAVTTGCTEALAALLLNSGVMIDVINSAFKTPLLLAAELNRSDAIELLIRSGAKPDRISGGGMNALHIAASNGHLEAVRTLLKHNIAMDCKDNGGETALMLAVKGDHQAVVEELLDAGANPNTTALHVAAAAGHAECVRALLAAGADPNAQNNLGYRPLHVASRRAIKELLEAGADVNARTVTGETALINAVSRGDCEDVRRLVEAGADVNVANDAGITPLTVAGWSGGCRVAGLLPGGSGLPPEPDVGYLEIVQLLQESGADPRQSARNVRACCWCNSVASGVTRYMGHQKVTDLLKKKKN